MDLDLAEFVDNPESRCPVILLLDTSDSMKGAPIAELNSGLAAFKYYVEEDPIAALRVDLAIITFGGEAKILQNFKTIDQFTAPQLEAHGNTPLGHALKLALDLLESRKDSYKRNGISYYRPWLFLMTDGAPTDGMLWYENATLAQKQDEEGKLSLYTIAVKGADMRILSQIAPSHRPPFLLKDLKFQELFQWLSASIGHVSNSSPSGEHHMLSLPSIRDWAETSS